ncbi:MAG TPA: hypothetical protein VOB72_18140 [Candidatus Dormibacteraeota bacterium]|nr:hypothetical protein [Candidatus Dormibacteraeota bacterium]
MKHALPLALLVLALAGCAGQAAPVTGSAAPSPAASAAPTQAPGLAPTANPVTVADLDAMARRVFPEPHPAGCGPIATCPIAQRLRARVEELSRPRPNQPGPVVQFCRCQNGASSLRVASGVTESGGIAHVVLVYEGGHDIALDLIFVRTPDAGLLLDDTQCTGRGPSTSLYAATLVGCAT